jgi:hypothetical protein
LISDNLYNKARAFADDIQGVLSQTVCSHAMIRASVRPEEDGERLFVVGHRVSKAEVLPARLALRVGTKAPRLWLEASFTVQMDAWGQYLTVRSSFFGVYPSEDAQHAIFHYDYERDKRDGYPDAHLQVAGNDETIARLLPGKPMEKLHFPVGGKRFRPCLEDVLEFLIREGLTEGREGYKEVLARGRDRFHAQQLRAAMRRSPEVVASFISDHPELVKE